LHKGISKPGPSARSDLTGLRSQFSEGWNPIRRILRCGLSRLLSLSLSVRPNSQYEGLASAIAVMVKTTLRKDLSRIDQKSARIILVNIGHRPLETFSEKISEPVRFRLIELGVRVRLGQSVQSIDEDGVVVGEERIFSKTVIWSAGVAPSPAAKWLGSALDRAWRVRIQPDLTIAEHPEIFVIGDTASLEQDGRPLPVVAQVAMQ
jgi:NADH:ubiquinone reductase (H+-translocating)